MLCDFCLKAFRESSENDYDPVLFSQPRPTVTSPSPFYKASHHSLPGLKQSASDGCQLCMLLWSAAPSKVHHVMDKILRDSQHAHWLPCYITADRAIFDARQSSRKILIEYKYELILTEPKNYVQPFKRHFRLLWSEGTSPTRRLTICPLSQRCYQHYTMLFVT
jgi:hypothetical protein